MAQKEMEEEIVLRGYLYSLQFYLLFVSVFFIGSVVLGYIGFLSELFSELFGSLQQLIEGIIDFTRLSPSWVIFLAFFSAIFLNNAFICFLNIVTGPLMGILPLFSAALNGGLIGWLAREVGLIVFLAIAPHGIFELPAYLLSVAIGLRLAREIFKPKGERQLKKELKNGFKVYLILIVPLLIIAALIESALIVAIM